MCAIFRPFSTIELNYYRLINNKNTIIQVEDKSVFISKDNGKTFEYRPGISIEDIKDPKEEVFECFGCKNFYPEEDIEYPNQCYECFLNDKYVDD